MNPAPSTIRAWRIDSPGAMSVADIPMPSPGSGEVLLRIRRIGYCGSDLSTFKGLNPLAGYPRIPGHEIAATIEALGAGVSPRWRVGDTVTVQPYTACGGCASCRRGRPYACRTNRTLGVQRDGALAPFVAIPEEKLLPSGGLDERRLALVEPLSVGYHAVRRGRFGKGDTVVVLGCGAIGLGAVLAAAHRGASVVAVDLEPAKLAQAKAFGAVETLVSGPDLESKLSALCGGEGPDGVIEAVGRPETFRLAVDVVAFTGRVVYIGYAKAEVSYDTRRFVQKELDILGSRNAEPEDFTEVMAMLRRPELPVESMITREVPFDGAGEALSAWAANPGSACKIHITL